MSRSQHAKKRLVFFEGCSYAFNLSDLLTASGELLGKGMFSSYKAVLKDGTEVVVKRSNEVSVGKRKFEQQMEVVGSIKHQNVVGPMAYYYSKDENLLVYDYYSQGSLAAMLHGKRGGEDRIPLSGEIRLRIAVGAAKGIAIIHGRKLVHGNIKSSNIFLNTHQYGCVSDLDLSSIMSPLAPPNDCVAGYRAPEVIDTQKVSQPSDVYSFGVLLLELISGRSPVQYPGGDEVIPFVQWVHSLICEEWTMEMVDSELWRYSTEEEMVGMLEMLKIAMACVVRVADQRPKMVEVVKRIENVAQTDSENRPSSEAKSESSNTTISTSF